MILIKYQDTTMGIISADSSGLHGSTPMAQQIADNAMEVSNGDVEAAYRHLAGRDNGYIRFENEGLA